MSTRARRHEICPPDLLAITLVGLLWGCAGGSSGGGSGGSIGGSGSGGSGAGSGGAAGGASGNGTGGDTGGGGISGSGGTGGGSGPGGAGPGAGGSGGGSTGSGGSAGATAGTGGRGGAAGSSGAGGSGGLPTVPDNGCNVRLSDTPIGFATMNGGTVGGGNAAPIMVTTPAALRMYLGDSQPRVLYVMNDMDFRTERRNGVMTCNENTTCDNGSGMQIDEPRVSATCDPNEHPSTSYRYEVRLDIESNKTVIGIGRGSGVTIYGSSLNLDSSSQVILRNFTLRDINPHIIEAGDGITLNNSSHVWLDHLLLTEISDGYVDIGSTTSTDRDVTLSWIRFGGRTPYECGGQHSYVNFADNVNATYHHNFFDNCGGRNPKIGESATVHLFNNYWLNVSYFCITAQSGGEARVESNYFENSSRPHWLQSDGNGIAIDNGNVYTGASSGNTNRDAGGSVFSVPYAYTKESAATARQRVLDCSGPQPIR